MNAMALERVNENENINFKEAYRSFLFTELDKSLGMSSNLDSESEKIIRDYDRTHTPWESLSMRLEAIGEAKLSTNSVLLKEFFKDKESLLESVLANKDVTQQKSFIRNESRLSDTSITVEKKNKRSIQEDINLLKSKFNTVQSFIQSNPKIQKEFSNYLNNQHQEKDRHLENKKQAPKLKNDDLSL